MNKIFEKISLKGPKYSGFDLSHEKKLSCKMGDLIPILLEEIVPGDQFHVNSEIMLRMAPMLAPIMHRVDVFCHYFFVPNRIVWSQWEDFITGGREGTTSPVMPTFPLNPLVANGSLADYLGLPNVESGAQANPPRVSELPFRAYTKIWNDYYRDPNLEEEVDVDDGSGIGPLFALRKRAWGKDYFTSALPFSQRGDAVTLPIDNTFSPQYKDTSTIHQATGQPWPNNSYTEINKQSNTDNVLAGIPAGVQVNAQIRNLNDPQTIDSTSVTIADLRRSVRLQEWLEKQARGGYRYIETLLSHFGVQSSDKRLQRAEYLGGGKQAVVISEVLNNTGTAEAPQGDMTGHGISMGKTNSFSKRFEEHGYVFGIMSVLPKTAYMQGVPRHWSRNDKFDYYWPEFANIGEQEVLNKELYYTGAGADSPDGVFGYQQRYAEYKYGCSMVHGDFRDTLNFWHMARDFASEPVLNSSFTQSDPTNRIFAVQDGTDTLWVQVYNEVKARRPMPYFADPRL